jgi:hypothetical protein
MTLLVFTPTIGDQMRPETVVSIKAQKTSVDYVWEVGYHNPFPEKLRNVVAQYQRAWGIALDGGYDALLTVEDDMVLPIDAIEKLYKTEAPVVYGVYMLRHGTKTLSAWRYENSRNMGMSLSLYPNEAKEAFERGWARVCGVGWGCTLIRREVLERVNIRSTGGGDAGDIAFATDCVQANILQIARFDVPCLHIEPNGNVLDPKYQGGIVARVLALQTVNVNVNGQSLPMKKDRYYTVPVDVGHELSRAGYVIITNDDDSQQAIGEREQPDISSREMAVNPKAATRGTRKAK